MKKIMFSGLCALALVAGCTNATGPNSCEYAYDGECDDGRYGAVSNACATGTDTADCIDVDPTVCFFTNDGECDDGRAGAVSSLCAPGTDDADCEGA